MEWTIKEEGGPEEASWLRININRVALVLMQLKDSRIRTAFHMIHALYETKSTLLKNLHQL